MSTRIILTTVIALVLTLAGGLGWPLTIACALLLTQACNDSWDALTTTTKGNG